MTVQWGVLSTGRSNAKFLAGVAVGRADAVGEARVIAALYAHAA